MSTKDRLSERDICSKFITPALQQAGWDLQQHIREEFSFTAGRIMVRGNAVKRGPRKRADYILRYKNISLALIEAKDQSHTVGDGMQQALGYAEILDIPFVYSSNGKGFLEHNRIGRGETVEQELSLESFPSPETLYRRYREARGFTPEVEKAATQDYYREAHKHPRYFQEVAINRVTQAIAKGQKRTLLVMATGTGKTYVASQIVWRLWKSRTKKRILFLVDRNILASQAMMNDFKQFGDKMTKIEHRNVDKAYEIYLALYQGITGTEEEKNIFKQFSPDFFDLIIVDECHRGSAKDNSVWRDVLEYYSSAAQLGLTATPKEEKDVSTQTYFGEPVYTYSLKQGIDDGFLAPYKVVRVTLDRDAEGYRPEKGKTDKIGTPLPDRVYSRTDFDRTLVIDERTTTVARQVTKFLHESGDRYQKTIVFCVDIDHAERMRQALVNENADLARENARYVVRITGDNEEGKKELDHFIDPESRYPAIATTSKLMTTGVDSQTCKLIVLDSVINSMSEFKQIIGRGTRVQEDYGKLFFTILDFRGVTELFADPAFDGDPVVVYESKEGGCAYPPPDADETETTDSDGSTTVYKPPTDGTGVVAEPRQRYEIEGVQVEVIHERVQYLDQDGKLITEALKDYTKKNILAQYRSLDEFLTAWDKAEKKNVLVRELEDRGVLLSALQEEVGKDLDPFDLVCHIAYGKKPLTRHERANNVKKRDYFTKYEGKAREIIDALLDKYADQGILAIDDIGDLAISPFVQFGTPLEIVSFFGGRQKYLNVVKKIEKELYAA